MSDIFISYASEDKGRVQALARALERKGWSVWWDRRIPAGKSFDDVIHDALKTARSVVVVWTKTSVKSTWVKNESRSGLRRNILFPVMLLDEVEIPLEFEHLQAAHLIDWQPGQEHAGFDQFLDDLAGIIGVPPSVAVQPSLVMQTQEPPPAPASPTPEAEGSLSKSATEVEPEPERQKPKSKPKRKPSSTMAGDVGSDSSVESVSSTEVSDVSRGDWESAQVNDDRLSESTGTGQSTEPLPYLPIGLGILAVMGAMVYFLIFSQSPSLGPRDVMPYQSSAPSPSTRAEVITPTSVPEPIKQPSVATAQEKLVVNQDVAGGRRVANTPRPTASKAKEVANREAQRRQSGVSTLSHDPLSTKDLSLGATKRTSSEKEEKTNTSTGAAEPPSVTGPAKIITSKDGATMVLVSGGSFQMGSTRDEVDREVKACMRERDTYQTACEPWYEPEFPQHQVDINAFYLDKYEVTNLLFQQFVQQTGHQTTAEREGSALAFVERKGWEETKGASWQQPEGNASVFLTSRGEHPVVAVAWGDARAYCRWAGKRLPTEAEFEYAMRAGTRTRYWWGDRSPEGRRVENIADESAKHLLKVVMSGYTDGAVRTAPVGYYEANFWGLYDMSGNVSEWVEDWYSRVYYGESPARNPKGPSSGEYRVIRGGSWANVPVNAHSATRNWNTPTLRDGHIGFRCARDVLK